MTTPESGRERCGSAGRIGRTLGMKLARRTIAGLVLILGLAVAEREARAESMSFGDFSGLRTFTDVALGFGMGLPSLGALVAGIANWVELDESNGPSDTALGWGYAMGSLSLLAGSVVLGIYLAGSCEDECVAVAATTSIPLALGAFSLTTTLLNQYHERSDEGVVLGPLVLDDGSGTPRYGLAMSGRF